MTNDQYIAALKKALSGLDETSRSDIIQEIQSHGAESDASLMERFGSPPDLAKQYLEGEVVRTPVSTKVVGASKKIFLWVGILASTMVAALVFFMWYASSDDFNYADETSSELDSTSADWTTKDWSSGVSIDIDQAHAVFYWHDNPTVRWQCNGTEAPVLDAKKLTIRQSKCLVMLPKLALKIIATQAKIVLIRPQASLAVNVKQTSLRIAENGNQYRYEVSENRTQFDGFTSKDDAEHTIKIEGLEATIEPYTQN